MMREWGMARGRVEAEITRRKEHNVKGSNFDKARGWVRSNWKTKKHDYKNETEADFLDPDNLSSGESADEVAEEIKPREYGVAKKRGDSPKQVNFVDLTVEEEEYGFRPSTHVQCEQLRSITDQNERLPAKKKGKETLPEIMTNNVHARDSFKVVIPKKKGAKPEVSLITKYAVIGNPDPTLPLGASKNRNSSAAAYSLGNAMLDVQQRKAK